MMSEQQVCRLCNTCKDTILLNIFSEENSYMLNEIEFLVNKKPSRNDTLPPYVCHKCNYKMLSVNDFRKQCVKTFNLFRLQSIEKEQEVIIIDGEDIDDDQRACSSVTGTQPYQYHTLSQVLIPNRQMANNKKRRNTGGYEAINLKTGPKETVTQFPQKRRTTEIAADSYWYQKQNMFRQVKDAALLTRKAKLPYGSLAGCSNAANIPETRPEVVRGETGISGFLTTPGGLSQHPARPRIEKASYFNRSPEVCSSAGMSSQRMEAAKHMASQTVSDSELVERNSHHRFIPSVSDRSRARPGLGIVQVDNVDNLRFHGQCVSRPNPGHQQYLTSDPSTSLSAIKKYIIRNSTGKKNVCSSHH